MEVTWSEFKKFVDARKCSIQFVEVKKNYWMKAISSSFEVECFIPVDPNNEDTIVFLESYIESSNKNTVIKQSAFTSNTTNDGKRLYKREQGVQHDVVNGENIIIYTIPYEWAKITGLSIVNGEALDTIDVFVLDSTTGTYTTYPNHQLNQFGFNVNMTEGFYSCYSSFESDLYLNMQIKIVYRSNTPKKSD